jgi:hypothetical protein
MIMKNDDWKNLILSVGKLHIRILSPIEVAQTIVKAEESGFTLKEIATRCLLKDPSILVKFKNLLKIREDYQYMIDWAEEGATISFTIAQSVAKWNPEIQKLILDAKIKYKLNKTEISNINQRIDRSGKTPEDCVKEAIAKKNKIIINVFIGSIFPETFKIIKDLTQYEKDKILKEYISSNYPDENIVNKVGKNEFTLLIYSVELFNRISSSALDIEKRVNELFQTAIL